MSFFFLYMYWDGWESVHMYSTPEGSKEYRVVKETERENYLTAHFSS